ncbi:MAG: NAD(P)-binding domain-containing protein, partial [Elusimicrobiota bacterium]
MDIKKSIKNRNFKIGIIGLGYVGLPLAVEFAKAGFETTGFEIDEDRVRDINSGQS